MTVMPIPNAIVIHGPGRSGTTLLYNILALHPDLCWVSGWNNRFPTMPAVALANRLQSISAMERLTRGRRFAPRPAEAYRFWDHYYPHFSGQNWLKHLNEGRPELCRAAIRSIVRWHSRNRFITKITGSSRSDVLAQIFEEPIIVYIDRDPRAVVTSYFRQRWHYKNRLGEFESRDRLELLQEYCDLYLRTLESKRELHRFPFVQVYYEDMVSRPTRFFEKLHHELDLSNSPRWFEIVRTWGINPQTNEAWKREWSEEESALLDRLLSNPLAELGYSEA